MVRFRKLLYKILLYYIFPILSLMFLGIFMSYKAEGIIHIKNIGALVFGNILFGGFLVLNRIWPDIYYATFLGHKSADSGFLLILMLITVNYFLLTDGVIAYWFIVLLTTTFIYYSLKYFKYKIIKKKAAQMNPELIPQPQTLPANEVILQKKSFPFKKSIFIFVIIIFVLPLIYFVLSKVKPEEKEATIINTPLPATSSASLPPNNKQGFINVSNEAITQSDNWKELTDKFVGFTIKFPDNWTISRNYHGVDYILSGYHGGRADYELKGPEGTVNFSIRGARGDFPCIIKDGKLVASGSALKIAYSSIVNLNLNGKQTPFCIKVEEGVEKYDAISNDLVFDNDFVTFNTVNSPFDENKQVIFQIIQSLRSVEVEIKP